jgi:small-conductance mechanosensitive channel
MIRQLFLAAAPAASSAASEAAPATAAPTAAATVAPTAASQAGTAAAGATDLPSFASPSNLPPVTQQAGWVGVLIFLFPLAMLVLGELLRQLQRQRHPLAGAVGIVRNLVLPAFSLHILLQQVMGMAAKTIPMRVADTLLWISLIYAALTLLNGVLFEEAPKGSWQSKVPQLFLDLGRFLLILIGSSIVLSTVWGADLGGFLTALGVGSLVLGLALQDSLGNIFSGVALLFEQPIALGDWIEIGENQGEVVEVNWRAVHLLTEQQILLIVPNSELGKTSFKNYNRPQSTYFETVPVSFSYDDPPNRVRQLLEATALEVEGVLRDPAPEINLIAYGDFAIQYQVQLPCPDPTRGPAIRYEFLRRLWYVARRNRLTMPYQGDELVNQPPHLSPQRIQAERLRVLREASCFAVLPAPLLDQIAAGAEVRDYAATEVVLDQGMALYGLYLILEGAAQLSVLDAKGHRRILGVLTTGEFFGERSSLLHDRISESTVLALEDLRVMVIDAETLQQAVDHNPRLAQDLGQVMEIRRRALESLEAEAGESALPSRATNPLPDRS